MDISGSTRVGEIIKLAGGYMMERTTNIDNFQLICINLKLYLFIYYAYNFKIKI
jgi:hypothetical protein